MRAWSFLGAIIGISAPAVGMAAGAAIWDQQPRVICQAAELISCTGSPFNCVRATTGFSISIDFARGLLQQVGSREAEQIVSRSNPSGVMGPASGVVSTKDSNRVISFGESRKSVSAGAVETSAIMTMNYPGAGGTVSRLVCVPSL